MFFLAVICQARDEFGYTIQESAGAATAGCHLKTCWVRCSCLFFDYFEIVNNHDCCLNNTLLLSIILVLPLLNFQGIFTFLKLVVHQIDIFVC